MYGRARLDIPASGNIGPSWTGGLSNRLAMLLGRIAAMTLPDRIPVEVTLNDGTSVHIGLDEHGQIELWDDMCEMIRRCYRTHCKLSDTRRSL